MSEENKTRELLRGTSRAQKYFLLTKCWLRPDSRVAVKYFTRKKLIFSCACMDSLFVLMDGWSGISFSKKHFRISVLYMSGWSGRPVEDDVFYIYLDEVAYSFPWNFMIRLFFFSLYFWIWYTNITFEYFRPHRVLFKNWIWWNTRTENVVKKLLLSQFVWKLEEKFLQKQYASLQWPSLTLAPFSDLKDGH